MIDDHDPKDIAALFGTNEIPEELEDLDINFDRGLTPYQAERLAEVDVALVELDGFLDDEEIPDGYEGSGVALLHRKDEGRVTLMLPHVEDDGSVSDEDVVEIHVPYDALLKFLTAGLTTLGLRRPGGGIPMPTGEDLEHYAEKSYGASIETFEELTEEESAQLHLLSGGRYS